MEFFGGGMGLCFAECFVDQDARAGAADGAVDEDRSRVFGVRHLAALIWGG